MNTNLYPNDFFDPSWIQFMDVDTSQQANHEAPEQTNELPPSSASSSAQQSSSSSQSTSMETEQEVAQLSALIQSLCTENSSEKRRKIVAEQGLANHIPADLLYPTSLQQLAMFFGDRVIFSSSLEGYCPALNIDFMVHVLSASSLKWPFDKEPLVQALRQLQTTTNELSKIKKEQDVLAFITKLKNQLSSLQVGERFLFPGGWTGSPGHFILYEIIATNQGFNFYLYNTGAGTCYHTGQILNQKEYINPTFSVLNIAKERLCSKHVLQYMVALPTKLYKNIDEVDESDIYKKFLFLLGGEFYSDESACLVLQQHAGTCSLKALMAFVKNWLPAHAQECLYAFQFWCLANFLRLKTQPDNAAEKRVIEKAVHGLANRTRKMYLSRLDATCSSQKKWVEEAELDRLLQVCMLCEKGLKIAKSFKQPIHPQHLSGDSSPATQHLLSKLDKKLQIKKSFSSVMTTPSSTKAATGAVATESDTIALWRAPELDHQDVLPFFESCLTQATEILKLFPKKDHIQVDPALSLAFYQLEKALLELPSLSAFNVIDLEPGQKKAVFTSLNKVAISYAKLSIRFKDESDSLVACANLWHLFFLSSQLVKEELSLDAYGLSFPLIKKLKSMEKQGQVILNLSLQMKLKDLIDYAELINADKDVKHFDTSLQGDSFTVTLTSYEQYADFRFIKHKLLQGSEEGELSLLETILTHYAKRPTKDAVLSQTYYRFRAIYFASLLCQDLSQKLIKPFITFKEKKQEYYTITFKKGNGPRAANVDFSFRSHFFSSLTYDILKNPYPQNQVRSLAKDQLLSPSNPQFPLLSKHELNRINDIQGAQHNRLSLALAIYKENPHYLEKEIHRTCLNHLFYEFLSLYQMMGKDPSLKTDLYHFFKTSLEFYKITDPRHKKAIELLYQLGWETWTLTQDAPLLSALKNQVLLDYPMICSQAGSYAFASFVLLFLAHADWLADQEIIQVLSIQVSHQIGWSQKTLPLLNKLDSILQDPQRRNRLLNGTQMITENLTSKQHTWTKDHLRFQCPEGSFDLMTGKLCIVLDQSLKRAKAQFADHLEEVIGMDLSPFFFKDHYWTDPQETIKILLSDKKTHVHRQFQDEWYRYCFFTQDLQHDLFRPPQEEKDENASNSTERLNTTSLRWYQSLTSSALLIGTNRDGKILYQVEKNVHGSWTISNSKGLLKAVEDPSSIPPSLSVLTHFTKVNDVTCWVNQETGKVTKVNVRAPLPLSIKKNKSDEWVIKDCEEYVIAADHSLCPFRSLPPYFHLVNAEKKYFALIPTFNLQVQDKGSHSNPFDLKHIFYLKEDDKEHDIDGFYLYEYDSLSGELIAKETNSRLYLAYLYFADQQYEKALQLLKKCQQTYPYGDKQLLFFENFFAYQQKNHVLIKAPEQSALLLTIASQVVEAFQFENVMLKSHQKKVCSPLAYFDKLSDHVIHYIRLIDTLPHTFRLSQQTELALLDHLSNNMTDDYQKEIVKQRRLAFTQREALTGNIVPLDGKPIKPKILTADSLDIPFSPADLKLKHFHYRTVLQDMTPLSWNCLRYKHQIADVNPSFVMAIWMGYLSDDPEDNAKAASKLFFLKTNKHKNKSEESRLDSLKRFLTVIFYTKVPFKQYLAGAHTDARQILDRWPAFIAPLREQKQQTDRWLSPTMPQSERDKMINQEKDKAIIQEWVSHVGKIEGSHLASHAGFYSLMPLTPIVATQNHSRQSLLMARHGQTIKEVAQTLNEKRGQLVKAFFVHQPTQGTSDFLKIHVDSKAQTRLENQPIAQALYNDFLKKWTASLLTWSFNQEGNPLDLFDALFQKVKQEKEALQTEYAQLEKTLEEEANATSLEQGDGLTVIDLQRALKRKIDYFSHQRKSITIDEMALMLLEGQWDKLLQRNGFLTPQDSEYLKAKMLQFMLLKTEYEVYAKAAERIDNWIGKLQKREGLEIAYCVQQAAEALTVKRYSLDQPNLLAFEYLTHLILRKNQVDKINQTLSFNPSHQVLKLMMGEGKTYVILPFLSKMLANGTSFPVIVAPASLYDEYLKNLKNTSEQQLSQQVFTWQFDRSSSIEIADLKTLDSMLESILKARGVLLTTAESLKALILKYEEVLITEEDVAQSSPAGSEGLKSRRQLLGHMIQRFRSSSIALIDEGHLALKSLTEMNFTLSTYEAITERETRTLLKIYQALKKMEFNFSVPLESDLSENGLGSFGAFKEALISHLYPSKEEKGIREYLQEKNPEFISVIEKVNADLAHEVALVKDELLSFLPFTLSKALNRDYGKHKANPDIEYAIPYVGAQKPSLSSEFGHKYVVINYTIQMLLQEGLTTRQFADWIKKLKAEALNKQVHLSQEVADAFIRQFMEDASIKNKNLDDESLIEQLCQTHGKKEAIVFHYLETILLPSLKFYYDKLSANEQDLGDFLFPKVLVMTGTPYNQNALPVPFQQQKTSQAISEEEKKLLYALSLPTNQKIYSVTEESHEQALALIKKFDQEEKHTHLAAFIDLGAYFKDVTSFEAAKKILASLDRIEGILFFEDKSNQLVCLRRGKEQPENYIPGLIPLHQLFAFFDNVHTFGAHIDLPSHAKALISLNQDTEKYALEQAIKRMRKLEETQTIAYVISSSLEKRLKELTSQLYIDVEALFLHAIFNEAKTLEKEIILSTMHQLKHLIKKTYLSRQLTEKEPLKQAREVLVEKLDFSPSLSFKQKVFPSAFFTSYCKRLRNTIPAISIGEFNYSSIILRAEKLLPLLIDENHSGEQNQEIQRQEEKKVEQLISRSSTFTPKQEEGWNIPDLLDIGSCCSPIQSTFHVPHNGRLICHQLNEFLEVLEGKSLSLICPDIVLTRNFAKTSELHVPNWEIPIKPVDYFVQIAFSSGLVYLIVSLQEASHLKEFFEGDNFNNWNFPRPIITLFSIQGKFIAGDAWNGGPHPLAFAQMKFFDGREYLSLEEEQAAMAWVQGKEELLVDLFAKLHRNRQTQQDYGNGNLFKLIMQSKELQKVHLAGYLQSSAVLGKRRRDEMPSAVEEKEDLMDVDVEEPVSKKQKTKHLSYLLAQKQQS